MTKDEKGPGKILYTERLTSVWTELLFLALTLLFAVLLIWRVSARGWDGYGVVFFFFTLVFLFYTINYRLLIIRISTEALTLHFGLFQWTTPLVDIRCCRLDDHIPAILRYGGAGIHFFVLHSRHRVSFNFLEYPRVVLELKQKRGPVQDVSFSTRTPDMIIALVQPMLPA